MKDVVWINDLKIRGSYGTLGNDQTTGGWQYISVANVNPFLCAWPGHPGEQCGRGLWEFCEYVADLGKGEIGEYRL